MRHAVIVFSCTALLLAGCATPYPVLSEDQATYHAELAAATIQAGDSVKAVSEIQYALERPSGGKKIHDLFSKQPRGRDFYYASLESWVSFASSPSTADLVVQKLSVARDAALFNAEQTTALFQRLEQRMLDGNANGSIAFTLNDSVQHFPGLREPKQERLIVERTIRMLQDKNDYRRPVKPVMDYVRRVGADSSMGRNVGSLLPSFNIRASELSAVEAVYPQYVALRKAEITATVAFEVKGADRLMRADLLQALRAKVKGVEWIDSASNAKVARVVVERLRYDERTLPERTQSITYAQHEVDMAKAVLLMPRNASFLYDVVSGGAEIEYGFTVSIVGGVQETEQIVRGRVVGGYQRCQNQRIQNVFGGISSAGFIANDDMQRRCAGNDHIAMDELRRNVLEKVVDAVVNLPEIRRVHELN